MYAINNILIFRGCINGIKNSIKRIPFEHTIKCISNNENFGLVLLSTGLLYKIHLNTFDLTELNSIVIQKSLPSDYTEKKSSIFGLPSACHDNIFNEMNDEFFTHISSGRSFTIVITNKNSVYNLPMKIYTFASHIRIKKISCGNEHCLILTTNGDLYAFGSSS